MPSLLYPVCRQPSRWRCISRLTLCTLSPTWDLPSTLKRLARTRTKGKSGSEVSKATRFDSRLLKRIARGRLLFPCLFQNPNSFHCQLVLADMQVSVEHFKDYPDQSEQINNFTESGHYSAWLLNSWVPYALASPGSEYSALPQTTTESSRDPASLQARN